MSNRPIIAGLVDEQTLYALAMTALTQTLATYRRNLDIVKRELEGFIEEQSHQVIGQSSSLNWIIGHQLSSRTWGLEMLEFKVTGLDIVAIQARYGKGTKPGPAESLSIS